MPRFTKTETEQAYEQLMKRKPNFERDPPELEIIQKDMEKIKKKGKSKNDFQR